ncbi:hypothetical protein HSBAA_16170 [Vreelandella sulfidaeris]|uniref:Uncharacterized protein n=1 Tax=Vreelandella sulfidaeris TaxID=115553 RepID=A0A455U750_9GAMM|nr:hypothetical protein HSBAA_16170 [Halomonas sulfidaeris]
MPNGTIIHSNSSVTAGACSNSVLNPPTVRPEARVLFMGAPTKTLEEQHLPWYPRQVRLSSVEVTGTLHGAFGGTLGTLERLLYRGITG